RHVAPLPDGQQPLQVISARVEVGEYEVARLVAGIDLIWRSRAVRWRRPMTIDADRDGDDGIRHDVPQLRARPTIDGAARQVEKQVDYPRRLFATEQSTIELLQPRPNAGKRCDRSE